MKTRVLCVGFSVTEMVTSYVPAAEAICRLEGIPFEFHKCGIGGVGVETLAYLIDEILDMHSDFKSVIFEIATGVGRVEFSARMAEPNNFLLMHHVEQIAQAALRRGVAIGFLNLPRLDVDYSHDILELSIFAVANRLVVPVHSVSYKAILGGVDLTAMLPDKVHVNEVGSEYYARALIELVSQGLSRGVGQSERGYGMFCAYPLSRNGNSALFFERHGYRASLIQIRPGDTITWSSPKPITLRGITFLSGPLSGQFKLSVDGHICGLIQSYDKYCYYERFNSAFIAPISANLVEINLMPEVPQSELVKGERDLSNRLMSFCHLLGSFD